jgi:pyruvate/2-oxoglutarate dehydrogenase complex dihydrolipoamide dehydrogenase (E3) component
MVGVETADFLGEHAHRVTIVEMLPEVARDEEAAVKFFLFERLNKYGVKFVTNATVKEFLTDGVLVDIEGKEEKLTGFDNIVLAMGVKSYNPLEEKIKGKVPEIYVIGDAVKPRKALEAIEEGARVAVRI